MKIALIGSAPSSVRLAPVQDKSYAAFAQGKQPAYPPSPWAAEEWEIWGCSPGAYGQLPRFTRFFEVHRWEPGQTWFSPEYCQFLREFSGKVYTGAPVPEIKDHIVYPLARVEAEFSSYFLTSSLSLMLALAILEIEDLRKRRPSMSHAEQEAARAANAEDVIGLWGVDMAASEEWAEQRPGCQHFILEALRRGIGIYVPPESDLLRPMPVYGISEWDHNYIKMTARAREFNQRRQQAELQLQEAHKHLHFVAGAADDLNYMVKTWSSPYGLPSGIVVRLAPGTGMGGGVTHVDGRPAVQLAVDNTGS